MRQKGKKKANGGYSSITASLKPFEHETEVINKDASIVLACEVIRQAWHDARNTKGLNQRTAIEFFKYPCLWWDCVDLNRDYFLKKLEEENVRV